MPTTLGYLTVRCHDQHGYFGGYLIVNHLARPVEFHCTLPMQPSRAQALLYGPTLNDFVCGEQIAGALIAKAKLKPDLVIVDTIPALAVSLVTEQTVVALRHEIDSSESGQHLKIPTQSQLELTEFNVSGCSMLMLQQCLEGRSVVEHLLAKLPTNFDLSEPFFRITEALVEAHPIAKAA